MQVKDKGKDMKTVYKGLKWKGITSFYKLLKNILNKNLIKFFLLLGRSNRSETSLRFHQPRSAPSSPTSDRRPIDFSSPPKSPNGFTATSSYRKDLRIRNSNFTDSRFVFVSIFFIIYYEI